MLVQLYLIVLLGTLPALVWSIKARHKLLMLVSLALISYNVSQILMYWSN